MGCICFKPKDTVEEELNLIIEDCKIRSLSSEKYIQIIKNAVNSNVDINDKFNFQTEILDLTIKSKELYLPISYLKSLLINLNEKAIKSYIIFALIFLCKFETFEILYKNFEELNNIVIDKFEIENFPIKTNKNNKKNNNANNIFLIKKIIEFYVKLLSILLLETYQFSLKNSVNYQKGKIDDLFLIYSDDVIKIFIEELFSAYNEINFDFYIFLQNKYNELNPHLIREKLYNTHLEKEISFKVKKNSNSKLDNNLLQKNNIIPFNEKEKESNSGNGTNEISKIQKQYNEHNNKKSNFNNKKYKKSEEEFDKEISDSLGDIRYNKKEKEIKEFYLEKNLKDKNKKNEEIINKNFFDSNYIGTDENLFSPSTPNKNDNPNLIPSSCSKNIETSYQNNLNSNDLNLFNLNSQNSETKRSDKIKINKDIKFDLLNENENENDLKINADKTFTLNNSNSNISNKKKNRVNFDSSIEYMENNDTLKNPKKKLFEPNNNNNNQNIDISIESDQLSLHNVENEFFSLKNFRKEALKVLNFKRILHDANVLNPSEELENYAQERAEYLAENQKFEKSKILINNEIVGENLSCFSDNTINGEHVIDEWYSEIEKYDFSNPKKKRSCSNFTQMIWKSTSLIGFGCKQSNSGDYFVVALFFPSGNIDEKYKEMISPLNENILEEINNMVSEDEN